MAFHKDHDGLQGVEGIKLDGATKWIGTSANVAAMDSTNLSACVISITNYSVVTSGVLDATSSDAATGATNLCTLIKALADQGILTISKDG